MRQTAELKKIKARVYTKARRRDLLFRSYQRVTADEWRYLVLNTDGSNVVWCADNIDEIEAYLDKAPPREWLD